MISVYFTEFAYIWVPLLIVSLGVAIFLTYLAIKAHRNRITTGEEGIVGEIGVYSGDGLVQVHGELWKVENGNEFSAGDKVEIVSLDSLIVKVKRI